jgi:hypothetical protein
VVNEIFCGSKTPKHHLSHPYLNVYVTMCGSDTKLLSRPGGINPAPAALSRGSFVDKVARQDTAIDKKSGKGDNRLWKPQLELNWLKGSGRRLQN